MNAYLDLASGVSGDMLLGALAHAGRRLDAAVEQMIIDAVASLDLDCSVSFVDDERGGLACLRAEVKTDGVAHNAERLREAIGRSSVAEAPRRRALAALDALVSAEARVHGTAPEEVHLHELASADTAADLLGSAVGFHALGVDSITTAPVPVPSGWIGSGHGPLPLPAPVTLELLTGARLRGVEDEHELVTPSGAAILVAHEAEVGGRLDLVLRAVGIGGGTRVTERPNICRLMLGEGPAESTAPTQTCVMLETNIDDQTPQALAHATRALLEQGALDVWVTPIVMKKSRPAFLLSVLAAPGTVDDLVKTVFRLTTTLGIRRRTTTRYLLAREETSVEIDGQRVRIKIARLGRDVARVSAEFDDCVRAAEQTGNTPAEVASRAVELVRAGLD